MSKPQKYRVKTWNWSTETRCGRAAMCFFVECKGSPCSDEECRPHLTRGLVMKDVMRVTVYAPDAESALGLALDTTGRGVGQITRVGRWWQRNSRSSS